LDEFNSFS